MNKKPLITALLFFAAAAMAIFSPQRPQDKNQTFDLQQLLKNVQANNEYDTLRFPFPGPIPNSPPMPWPPEY
jgi:hypothetical protein